MAIGRSLGSRTRGSGMREGRASQLHRVSVARGGDIHEAGVGAFGEVGIGTAVAVSLPDIPREREAGSVASARGLASAAARAASAVPEQGGGASQPEERTRQRRGEPHPLRPLAQVMPQALPCRCNRYPRAPLGPATSGLT